MTAAVHQALVGNRDDQQTRGRALLAAQADGRLVSMSSYDWHEMTAQLAVDGIELPDELFGVHVAAERCDELAADVDRCAEQATNPDHAVSLRGIAGVLRHAAHEGGAMTY